VIDDESFEVSFWGVHASRTRMWGSVNGDLFLFGLEENDPWLAATSARRAFASR
jgi:hypothetical protein